MTRDQNRTHDEDQDEHDEHDEDEDHLERAREHLRRASDLADRPIQTQVDSIQEGLAEELAGERTQDDPGPKVNRIAGVIDKLEGLEQEASMAVRPRLIHAREACVAYQKERADDSA